MAWQNVPLLDGQSSVFNYDVFTVQYIPIYSYGAMADYMNVSLALRSNLNGTIIENGNYKITAETQWDTTITVSFWDSGSVISTLNFGSFGGTTYITWCIGIDETNQTGSIRLFYTNYDNASVVSGGTQVNYLLNTNWCYNFIKGITPPSYNWQSVPSISGKNGILSLAQIKEEYINDGESVSGASADHFTNLSTENRVDVLIDDALPAPEIGGTTVTVKYTIPSLSTGSYEYCKLVAKKNSMPESAEDGDKIVNLDPTKTSVTISGLNGETKYYFVIFIKDSNDSEASSDPKSITTGISQDIILFDLENHIRDPRLIANTGTAYFHIDDTEEAFNMQTSDYPSQVLTGAWGFCSEPILEENKRYLNVRFNFKNLRAHTVDKGLYMGLQYGNKGTWVYTLASFAASTGVNLLGIRMQDDYTKQLITADYWDPDKVGEEVPNEMGQLVFSLDLDALECKDFCFGMRSWDTSFNFDKVWLSGDSEKTDFSKLYIFKTEWLAAASGLDDVNLPFGYERRYQNSSGYISISNGWLSFAYAYNKVIGFSTSVAKGRYSKCKVHVKVPSGTTGQYNYSAIMFVKDWHPGTYTDSAFYRYKEVWFTKYDSTSEWISSQDGVTINSTQHNTLNEQTVEIDISSVNEACEGDRFFVALYGIDCTLNVSDVWFE